MFDFDTYLDRAGRDALALDAIGTAVPNAPKKPKDGFDTIPMWIADMNFKTAPAVVESIEKRLEHPIFGYFPLPDAYFESIQSWQARRNGVLDIPRAAIGYENGVLGGVVSALRAMTEPGAPILVNSPTYVGFTGALTMNGYKIIHSPLRKENGRYVLDLADMEDKIQKEKVQAVIFCSPHNPAGRVWERAELESAFALFEKYRLPVISDEIWSDIILDSHKHIPSQSVSEYAKMNTVALYAPTKTFNLAALVGSYHIIYNEDLREKIDAISHATDYNNANVLSVYSLIGGYSEAGEAWVNVLCKKLSENVSLACYYFRKLPGVSLQKPEGTYMLFPDFTSWCEKHGVTMDELLERAWDVGVGWQDGRPFHGAYNLRINVALPTAKLREALDRLSKYVFNED